MSGPIPIPELLASLKELQSLQQEQKYPELAKKLLEFLTVIFKQFYASLSPEEHKLFSLLAVLVLKIFADPKFKIPRELELPYLNNTVFIGNLVALTNLKNTDMALKLLVEEKAPLVKVLCLYSFYNRITLDVEQLFNQNPTLVYEWMNFVVTQGHRSCVILEGQAWMKKMLSLKALHTRTDYMTSRYIHPMGFTCSYISPSLDKSVKTAINKAMKTCIPHPPALQEYDFKKVLVVSNRMLSRHAVFKSLSPLIDSLKDSYEVKYITPPWSDEELEQYLQNRLKSYDHAEWQISKVMQRILQEKAGVIIYPEIGMSSVPVALSNLRLAPIQLSMYGHPCSSYAGELDYFVVSQEVEALDKLQQNYSERAVAIPGLAAISVYPQYERQYPQREEKYHDKVIINCAWGSMKMGADSIQLLKKASERSKSHLIFRFTDLYKNYLAYISVIGELKRILGKEHMEHVHDLPYPDYMYVLEHGDFALDSYPFCGFNRTVDTLHCGVPMVTLEGDKAYNRFGGAILRRAGMPELIATNEEEYIDLIVKMADDAAFRQEMKARVDALDLRKMLCNTEEAIYFKKAIDYLVANHAILQQQSSRDPIIIAREELHA